MTGYASSCDDKLCCDKIIVTAIKDGDCYFNQAEAKKEIYSVNRKFTKTERLFSEDGNFSVKSSALIKIAKLLHCEEIKNRCGCKVYWQSTDFSFIEKGKLEFVENAYFPTPLYIDNCRSLCINITSQIFEKTPKPLGASIVCEALNFIIAKTELKIPDSFFNCMNSVFCSEDVMLLLKYIFGDASSIKAFPRSLRRLNIQREILKPLSDFCSFSSSGNGCLAFFIDAKREYVFKTCKSFTECINAQNGYSRFFALLSKHTSEFLDKLTDLAGIFISSENINSISDIHYLTIYELQSAFAFFEFRLSLKQKIIHHKLRQRILNKQSTPCFIDNEINI